MRLQALFSRRAPLPERKGRRSRRGRITLSSMASVFFTASAAPPRTRRPSCFCTGDPDKAASISRHWGDGY